MDTDVSHAVEERLSRLEETVFKVDQEKVPEEELREDDE
jgi:hypothetical protein